MSKRTGRAGSRPPSRPPKRRTRLHPGAAPGTIRTAPELGRPAISVVSYGPDELVEETVDVARVAGQRGRRPVTWVNVTGLGDPGVLRAVGDAFDLHDLALEDVVNVHQRAKVETYGDKLFVVARMLELGETLASDQLSLFIGPDFVVTPGAARNGDGLCRVLGSGRRRTKASASRRTPYGSSRGSRGASSASAPWAAAARGLPGARRGAYARAAQRQGAALSEQPPVPAPPPDPEALEREFKAALGSWATGVSVVTTKHEGLLYGLTVSSFTSVSLDPPLVLVCLATSNRMGEMIQGSGRFGVSILAADQEAASNYFASPGREPTEGFVEIEGQWTPFEVPVVKGSLAHVVCEVHDASLQGDHLVVIGRVLHAETMAGGAPLLYYRRGYRALAQDGA